MTAIPKQPAKRKDTKKAQQAPAENVTKVVVTGPDFHHMSPSRSMQHAINHVAGLDGIEGSLDNLVSAVARLTHDDHSVGLSIGQNRYSGPVQITLADNDESDTMDRLVTAVERIADSVAKLAGLTRPRLESWHEQEEYEPRYKAVACDGGAPGPATPPERKAA
jgi:hypothetical protein